MAKIINLNRARKRRARAADKANAAENRAAFGQSKNESGAVQAEADRQARVLDGARRDPSTSGEDISGPE